MGKILHLEKAKKLNIGNMVQFRKKEGTKYKRLDALLLGELTSTDDFRVLTKEDTGPVFIKRSQITAVYENNIWDLNDSWNAIEIQIS